MENKLIGRKKYRTKRTLDAFCPRRIITRRNKLSATAPSTFMINLVFKKMRLERFTRRIHSKYTLLRKFKYHLTSNAKFSGSFGGELSPRKLLHSLSASRFVIIPQRLDDIGIAPALRSISSYNWKKRLDLLDFPSGKRIIQIWVLALNVLEQWINNGYVPGLACIEHKWFQGQLCGCESHYKNNPSRGCSRFEPGRDALCLPLLKRQFLPHANNSFQPKHKVCLLNALNDINI